MRHAADTEGGRKASFSLVQGPFTISAYHQTMRICVLITFLAFTITSPAQVVITGDDGVITVERDGHVTTYEYDEEQPVSQRQTRKTIYYNFVSLPQHTMNPAHARYFALRDLNRFVLQPYFDSLPEVVYVEPRRRFKRKYRRRWN